MKRIDREIFISNNTHKHSKKKRTLKRLKCFTVLFFISSIIAVLFYNFPKIKKALFASQIISSNSVENLEKNDQSPTITATATSEDTNLTTKALSEIKPSDDMNKLSSQISAIIAKYPDKDFAVSFYDLNTKESFNINGSTPFIAASTAKLIAAGTVLTDVENDKYKISTVIDGYTVKEHLWYMLNQSNNFSWETLNNKVTYANESNYAQNIGLDNYNPNDNSLSANDLTTFLVNLAQGKLLNQEYTNLFLNYIHKTNEESYLPDGLSPNLTVYHKYGLYNGYAHDAGIIKGQNCWYVLTIMSSDKQNLEDYTERADIFHEITALFANYN